MAKIKFAAAVVFCCFAIPARLPAQQVKPQSVHEYECYVQSAEARMAARKAFLMADTDPALMQSVARGRKVETSPGNGPNPHKVSGAQVYDVIGTVLIPGVTGEAMVRTLQNYDKRPQYFPGIIGSAQLACRTGDHFGFTMRLLEPVVADSENDVVWEKVDAHRWRYRSYSTKIKEVGKERGYVLRLNSYWRLFEDDRGVFVEGQTISLSGEFSAALRTLGSLAGINPEKSLKKTLETLRDAIHKSGVDTAGPAAGKPECGEPVHLAGCTSQP